MYTLLTGQIDTGNTDLPHCMDSIAYQSFIAFWESDEEETFEGAGLSQRPLWDQAKVSNLCRIRPETGTPSGAGPSQ